MKFAAWAEINLDALQHNLETIRTYVGADKKVILVVKADAYGHGGVQVARIAQKQGVAMLGVATLHEGIELRNAGITIPILILGPSLTDEIEEIVTFGLRPTVCDYEFAQRFGRINQTSKSPVPVHVEVDTGMGRTGVRVDAAHDFLMQLADTPGIEIEGVFTHFPDCDTEDKTFARQQTERFSKLIKSLEASGVSLPIRHAANSAGVLSLPESHLDAVRPGLMAFGLHPPHSETRLQLRPVMMLKSRIVQLREFEKGESVGYGRSYVIRQRSLLAAVPVGYGHGYGWQLSNRGSVLVGGKRVPILGRVSMDITMVDVSGVNGVTTGDEVVLFGTQGSEYISVDEVAAQSNTINYEVMCGIGKRVVRVFTRNGKADDVVTMLGDRFASLLSNGGKR